ncbi:MAG: hypothetical protein ABIF84_00630 [Patescibacteria group bacterium]
MCDLKVKCVKCGKEWKKDGGEKISWGENDISGSLCDDCFVQKAVPLVRRKQIKEGNFDCFGKAENNYCDQAVCKYRRFCFKISSFLPNVLFTNTLHP